MLAWPDLNLPPINLLNGPNMIYGHTPPWPEKDSDIYDPNNYRRDYQKQMDAYRDKCNTVHDTIVSSLNVQVQGDHYKNLKIQPVEYIHANNLPFIEGNIVKYITRWRDKDGIKDLEKIKHFVDILIELEKKSANS